MALEYDKKLYSRPAPMINNEIYLASRSPRRLELLQQIGLHVTVVSMRENRARAIDVDETPYEAEPAHLYVERIAKLKCDIGWLRISQRRLPNKPLLAADTIVVFQGHIYGKPATQEDAFNTLTTLSGNTHEVITAVAATKGDATLHDTCVSRVRFRVLSETEILRYISSGEPMDKAGAYGIQGAAGMWVERLEGSYSGVMGLPLFETAELLKRLDIRLTE